VKTEEQESTAIEVVIAQTPSVALLDPKQKEELYAFLEREIDAFVPDLSTETSRKQIASLAYKVSRTKTAIDDAGAALKSEWLKKSQAIDVSRREIRDRLDALRDRARQPLTDWEKEEENRAAWVAEAFEKFRSVVVIRADDTSETVAMLLKACAQEPLQVSIFQERFDEAKHAKAAAVQSLSASLARVQQQEAEKLELARLRAEAEARAIADREAAEAAELARLMKEREEREKQRLADMEAARKAEEARQVALAEQAKARSRIETEALLERNRIEAEYQAEIRKARQAQESAEASEREARERIERDIRVAGEADRIRKEQAERKAAEEAKIAANKKHRAAVMTAAKVALIEHCGVDEDTARKVVLAISSGKIPAVTWSWI